jgi:F420-dependent oxidoreductase-like protein
VSARFGVIAPVTRRFGPAIARVQLAERLGCDSVWVTQQENSRDALVTLAAYGPATSQIGLGTAVLPIHALHPTALLQAAATLDELCGGRFRLGLGTGHGSIVADAWGLQPGRPLAVMREYLGIVRSGLREGTVDHQGERFRVRWTYSGPPPARPPVLVAALRPWMLELAGELADGVIVWMATPEYVKDTVLPAIRRGRAAAGLSLEGFEIMVIVNICGTEDVDFGREMVSKMLQPALRFDAYRSLLAAEGLAANAAGEPGPEVLDRIAAVGGLDLIQARIAAYRAAGCTLPVVVALPGPPGGGGPGGNAGRRRQLRDLGQLELADRGHRPSVDSNRALEHGHTGLQAAKRHTECHPVTGTDVAPPRDLAGGGQPPASGPAPGQAEGGDLHEVGQDEHTRQHREAREMGLENGVCRGNVPDRGPAAVVRPRLQAVDRGRQGLSR